MKDFESNPKEYSNTFYQRTINFNITELKQWIADLSLPERSSQDLEFRVLYLRFKNKNELAGGEIISLLQPIAFYNAQKIFKDEDVIEDAVQFALCLFWEKSILKYNEKGKFITYAGRCIYNALITYNRKLNRKKQPNISNFSDVLGDKLYEDDYQDDFFAEFNSVDGKDFYNQMANIEIILKCVCKLEYKQRVIMEYIINLDYSLPEIAKETGWHLQTVTSHYYQGRKEVKKLMDLYEEIGDKLWED